MGFPGGYSPIFLWPEWAQTQMWDCLIRHHPLRRRGVIESFQIHEEFHKN